MPRRQSMAGAIAYRKADCIRVSVEGRKGDKGR